MKTQKLMELSARFFDLHRFIEQNHPDIEQWLKKNPKWLEIFDKSIAKCHDCVAQIQNEMAKIINEVNR